MSIRFKGPVIKAGFEFKGANTDPNRPPQRAQIDQGPQRGRDPAYPERIQGWGASGGGGNHDFGGYDKWKMAREVTFGKVNGTPFMVERSAGTLGYLQAEGTYSHRASGKIDHASDSSKTTGHGAGPIHHHGSHWHGNDGKSKGFAPAEGKPTRGILKHIIK